MYRMKYDHMYPHFLFQFSLHLPDMPPSQLHVFDFAVLCLFIDNPLSPVCMDVGQGKATSVHIFHKQWFSLPWQLSMNNGSWEWSVPWRSSRDDLCLCWDGLVMTLCKWPCLLWGCDSESPVMSWRQHSTGPFSTHWLLHSVRLLFWDGPLALVVVDRCPA